MTKSLLTGFVVCATLAMFSGNSFAHKARIHKTHRIPMWTNSMPRGSLPYGTRVNPGPHGDDPLYDSCEYPWRHPEVQCPGNDNGG